MFRKLLIFIAFFLVLNPYLSFSDEGMWLPILLKELKEKDMQDKGLKLSADEIYNINKTSLKDAVVHFNFGCTAEVISSGGLILTNHHCGYEQIQIHSTVKQDYLTDGFWAKNNDEELPNPGLKVTFIIRMEDVTAQVLKGIDSTMTENKRESIIKENTSQIIKESTAGTHYDAIIKPFYYGNEYYMFITETFKDIRLVGAPPSSIGKFGGDTDNWMWPRHTGDFSLFRIYAGKDNKPAEYSKENKPFIPRYFFPISLKGVNKDDFTMVYGFPGRTQEYIPSFAVDLVQNISNPAKVRFRNIRLKTWDQNMQNDPLVRIKYSAKYASVSNYYKKMMGESKGLFLLKAIEKKQKSEESFHKWANENEENKKQYGMVLEQFKKVYSAHNDLQLSQDYLQEVFFAIEIFNLARKFLPLYELYIAKDTSMKKWENEFSALKKDIGSFYKNYDLITDKEVFQQLFPVFYDDVPGKYKIHDLLKYESKYKKNVNSICEYLYKKTFLKDSLITYSLIFKEDKKWLKQLTNDPVFQVVYSVQNHFKKNIDPEYFKNADKIYELNKIYMKGLREMQPHRKFYPDANSTLRITYGVVDDYKPRDGVKYTFYTTLDGIVEKYDPNNKDFIVPEKLFSLWKNKDYGKYAQNNELHVCFIASNHTTGGNSGSPVINAEGQLIGTNFDRNWEGTMSDILYDPDRVRNIVLDIRYTLFIIDKFAGAGYLLNEMKIVE